MRLDVLARPHCGSRRVVHVQVAASCWTRPSSSSRTTPWTMAPRCRKATSSWPSSPWTRDRFPNLRRSYCGHAGYRPRLAAPASSRVARGAYGL